MEDAISHNHLISLCVYTYEFYWILNICQSLSHLIPWEVNAIVISSFTDRRSERVQVTCLKLQSSNVTDGKRNGSNSRNSLLITNLPALYTHFVLCICLNTSFKHRIQRCKRPIVPLISQSHQYTSPRNGESHCSVTIIDFMNPYSES